MKQILAISFVLFLSATAVAANIYDDCAAAISSGNTETVNEIANRLRMFNSFSQNSLKQAEACVSASAGEPMVYGSLGWMALSDREKLLATKAAEEAARREREATAEAAAEAERIERQKLQSKLETELAELEKHNACILAKRSELLSEIEAVDNQNNETNNSLIINDTYSACSELYLKDKSSVMLNQSCIDAFKRLGHPNLVMAGDELKSSFMDQLGELSTLRGNLVMEQNEVTDALRTFMGFPNAQDILSAASEAVEEKSCAEFGYEGVYRD